MTLEADIVVQDTTFAANVEFPDTSFSADVTVNQGAQGPKGDKGDPGDTAVITISNAEPTATIYAGMAVTMAGNGSGVIRASFDDEDKLAFAVALTTAAPGEDLNIAVVGVADVADWTQATGGAWLSANTRLFLAANGTLTTTPTATAGQYDQVIGTVLSPQELVVLPGNFVAVT